MKSFPVWLIRLDGASDLRVDGLENTNWLLERLSNVFVFKTSEPLQFLSNSPGYTFRVAHSSQLSDRQLQKVLAGIAEVKVVLVPSPPELVDG